MELPPNALDAIATRSRGFPLMSSSSSSRKLQRGSPDRAATGHCRPRAGRHANQRQTNDHLANRQSGEKLLPHPLSHPKNRVSERQTAQDVRVPLASKPRGVLAHITDKSKESAKDWKAGKACPHFAQIVNLARSMPDFRAWCIEYLGGDTGQLAPSVLEKLLTRVAVQETQQGAWARQMLATANGGGE